MSVDPQRRERLINAFRIFDVKKDGTVDTKAIALILSNLGKKMSPHEISELISDADQGGRIYYTEYIDKVLLAPPK